MITIILQYLNNRKLICLSFIVSDEEIIPNE